MKRIWKYLTGRSFDRHFLLVMSLIVAYMAVTDPTKETGMFLMILIIGTMIVDRLDGKK